MTIPVTISTPTYVSPGVTRATVRASGATAPTEAEWVLRFEPTVLRALGVHPIPQHAAVLSGTPGGLENGFVSVSLATDPNSTLPFDPGFLVDFRVIGPPGASTDVSVELVSLASSAGSDSAPWTSTRVIVKPDPMQTPYGLQATLPSGVTGQPYEFQLEAMGGVPPYHWLGASLPDGLQLLDAGTIIGRPASPGEQISVELTVSDSDESPSSTSLAATIPSITAGALSVSFDVPDQIVGWFAGGTVEPRGGTPPFRAIAAGLPPGTTLTSDGRFLGRPTQPGSFALTASVRDETGIQASATTTIHVHGINPRNIAVAQIPDGAALLALPSAIPLPFDLILDIAGPPAVTEQLTVSLDDATLWSGIWKSPLKIPVSAASGGPHIVSVALDAQASATVWLTDVTVSPAANHPRFGAAPTMVTLSQPGSRLTPGSSVEVPLVFPTTNDDLIVATSQGVELLALAEDLGAVYSQALSAPGVDLLACANPGSAGSHCVVGRGVQQVVGFRQAPDGSWSTNTHALSAACGGLDGALDATGTFVAFCGQPSGVAAVGLDANTAAPIAACGQSPAGDDVVAVLCEWLDDGGLQVNAANRRTDCVGRLTYGSSPILSATPSVQVVQTPRQPSALTRRPPGLAGPLVLTQAVGEATVVGSPAQTFPLGGHPSAGFTATLEPGGAPMLFAQDQVSDVLACASLSTTATPEPDRLMQRNVRSIVAVRGAQGSIAVVWLDDSGTITAWPSTIAQPHLQFRPATVTVSGGVGSLLVGNCGNAALTISALTLTGIAAGAVSVGSQTPLTIFAQSALAVTLTCAPSTPTGQGVLLIDSNDPLLPRVSVPITVS